MYPSYMYRLVESARSQICLLVTVAKERDNVTSCPLAVKVSTCRSTCHFSSHLIGQSKSQGPCLTSWGAGKCKSARRRTGIFGG